MLAYVVPVALCGTIMSIAAASTNPTAGAIIGLIFVAMLVGLIAYVRAKWDRYTFQAADSAFVITKGIFWKRQLVIPYFRIQQIDINRDIFAQIIGVSSVLVSTASRQPDPVIYGVSPQVAADLRAFLLASAGTTNAV